MSEGDDGEWHLTGDGPELPLSFTLEAVAR